MTQTDLPPAVTFTALVPAPAAGLPWVALRTAAGDCLSPVDAAALYPHELADFLLQRVVTFYADVPLAPSTWFLSGRSLRGSSKLLGCVCPRASEWIIFNPVPFLHLGSGDLCKLGCIFNAHFCQSF